MSREQPDRKNADRSQSTLDEATYECPDCGLECFAEPAAAKAEIERLREDCAQFYQVIGYLANQARLFNDPQTVKALDNACAAAEGEPRPHTDLLPFTANVRDEPDV